MQSIRWTTRRTSIFFFFSRFATRLAELAADMLYLEHALGLCCDLAYPFKYCGTVQQYTCGRRTEEQPVVLLVAVQAVRGRSWIHDVLVRQCSCAWHSVCSGDLTEPRNCPSMRSAEISPANRAEFDQGLGEIEAVRHCHAQGCLLCQWRRP
jgi:hypothetical protein